jgi:hypothetical protein
VSLVLIGAGVWRLIAVNVRNAEIRSWPTVDATVTAVYEGKDYDTEIMYAVDGVEYRFRSEYGFSFTSEGDSAYPVRVDPDDPSVAYTSEDTSSGLDFPISLISLGAIGLVWGGVSLAPKRKTGQRPSKKWDEASFLAEMAAKAPEAVPIARRILDWAAERGLRTRWGRGAVVGSFTPILNWDGDRHPLVWIGTNGRVEFQFAAMAKCKPFGPAKRREALRQRLNEVPGVSVPPDGIDRYPTALLPDIGPSIENLLAVWDWYLDQVRASD